MLSNNNSGVARMNNNKTDAIAGAQAGLNALRAMEAIVADGSRDYYAERELMVSTLMNAAGTLSPYMRGFIAVLAEYIDLQLGLGAKPAHHWTPEAVMSQTEIISSRKESYATVSA